MIWSKFTNKNDFLHFNEIWLMFWPIPIYETNAIQLHFLVQLFLYLSQWSGLICPIFCTRLYSRDIHCALVLTLLSKTCFCQNRWEIYSGLLIMSKLYIRTAIWYVLNLRIFKIFRNIYLFSSSCLTFVRWKKKSNKYYRISAKSFRGNYSFLNLTLCTKTFDHSTYRCENYSREECKSVWLCG